MKWKIDSNHSFANFKVQHMGIAWVTGSFYGINGEIEFDPETPEKTGFEGSVDTTTVTTGNEYRDNHLKGEDFLNVEKYPEMSFVSKSTELVGKDSAKVTGDIKIAGVVKSITFDVTFLGSDERFTMDGGKEEVAAFQMKSELDRTDFGLNWNMDLPNGKALVGDKVQIELNVEAVKVK